MNNTLRDEIINKIITREGGYIFDPDDSGGETNWGITRFVARRAGYTGAMKEMPREVAFDIYCQKYWHNLSLDVIETISTRVAAKIADTGVNMGTARAAEFLQRSLNALNNRGSHYDDLLVDSDIGPATLGALQALINNRKNDGITVLLRMINSLQGAFYVELAERRPKDERFIFGWFLHRIAIID